MKERAPLTTLYVAICQVNIPIFYAKMTLFIYFTEKKNTANSSHMTSEVGPPICLQKS